MAASQATSAVPLRSITTRSWSRRVSAGIMPPPPRRGPARRVPSGPPPPLAELLRAVGAVAAGGHDHVDAADVEHVLSGDLADIGADRVLVEDPVDARAGAALLGVVTAATAAAGGGGAALRWAGALAAAAGDIHDDAADVGDVLQRDAVDVDVDVVAVADAVDRAAGAVGGGPGGLVGLGVFAGPVRGRL